MKMNLMKTTVLIAVFLLFQLTLNAQNVAVDNYYNHETTKTADGKTVDFHYLWDDKEWTGFSIFGQSLINNGAKQLTVLKEAPTAANLKNTDVYIIVDPDHLGDNPTPNYMTETDAKTIAKWVKKGGVLFLMANDKENADLEHFNLLADKFGFTFNNDLILFVKDDEHFDDGGLATENSSIFKTAQHIFIKNASSINISGKAMAVLKTKDGKVAMAMVNYGKGKVLAVGDPWLYNEYTNGRLPAKFDNDKAANDVAKWLLDNARH